MALTISNLRNESEGSLKKAMFTLTFDSSYATGGETLTALNIGLSMIESLKFGDSEGYTYDADVAANKASALIKAYRTSGVAGGVTGATSGGTPSQTTGVSLADTSGGTPSEATAATAALDGAPVFTADAKDFKSLDLYDILGSLNTDSENVDSAADTTNGDAVAADAAVAVGAWAHGALTNPDVVRNVCISIENPTGGPLNLFEGVMTFTVTGTDYLDAVLTEDITFTSSAINKAIAAGQFRFKFGVRPFKTVTDVTLDNVPDNALVISAGIGSKIHLLNPLFTPAEADVVRTAINVTNYAFAGLVDTTYPSINFATLSDGDDIHAVFAVLSGRTGTCSTPTITVTPGTYDALAAHNHVVTDATYDALATHTHTTPAVSAGALIEVSNGVDLSSIAIDVEVSGH